MADIPLRCSCGQLQGVVIDLQPEGCNHVVCYCDDCQAFARHLGTAGMMDDRGGTEIVQVYPAQLRFTAGVEQLRLLRLSEKGLLRWYTACCRSPVANMLSAPRSPFVGLFSAILPGEAARAAMGPVVGKIQGRFAVGGCPPGVHPRAPAGLLWRSGVFLVRGLWGGKHAPSPFFDGATGKPICEATVLTQQEGVRLYGPF
jgi:hypothetical protein